MWETFIKIGGAFVSAFITAILIAKDVQELATPFGFQVPGAPTAFVIFLLFVTWWIVGLETYKRRRENSKPHLVWLENHGPALYAKEANETAKVGDYIYHVLQIWFKNRPRVSTDDSVAKDITAMVTFYDRTSKSKMPVPGCFIIAEALDYAGNTGKYEEIIDTWAPNDEPHKLQIAVKRQEDDSAYGFGKGTDIGAKKIWKSKYYIQVDIKGTRVVDLQPFWFALENLGSGHELSLSKPIKKPDLRREGFQTE